MKRFFRPENAIHALKLLTGQAESINDLPGKKQMDMYCVDVQEKKVFQKHLTTLEILLHWAPAIKSKA